MAWLYIQNSGSLYRADGFKTANGYAGCGEGLNNPDLQNVPKIGPIPVGIYSIGAPVDHPRLGKFSLPLIPDPANEMFGRDDFFCHGDSVHYEGQHVASEGCIIMPRLIREKMWNSEDHILKVVRTYND
jgi:hypothetical protein